MTGEKAGKPLLLTNVKPMAFGAGSPDAATDILVDVDEQAGHDEVKEDIRLRQDLGPAESLQKVLCNGLDILRGPETTQRYDTSRRDSEMEA